MLYVSQITSASSGFDQFQRGEEVRAEFDGSVSEFAASNATNNYQIRAHLVAGQPASDEDEERLAARLREISGAVLGGHDTLVAYLLTDGQIIVESVREVE